MAFRFAMMVEAAVGRGRKSEGSGKARVVTKLGAWRNGVSTPLSIRLWDPQGRDEAVAQEAAQNSVGKGAHLGPSIEGERARRNIVSFVGGG